MKLLSILKVVSDIINIKNSKLVIVDEVHDLSGQIFSHFQSRKSKATISRKVLNFKHFLCSVQLHAFFINFIHSLWMHWLTNLETIIATKFMTKDENWDILLVKRENYWKKMIWFFPYKNKFVVNLRWDGTFSRLLHNLYQEIQLHGSFCH